MRALFLSILCTAVLSACGSSRGLHSTTNVGGGPDEFSVQPVRPLELPADLNTLPAPTLGGANLTDPNPTGQAIAALGGNPNAANAGGIPSADAGLVAFAGRNGVDPAIRSTLAAEDAQLRNRRGRFFGGNGYFALYSAQALDAYAEWLRFQNAGVQVPSAPPAN